MYTYIYIEKISKQIKEHFAQPSHSDSRLMVVGECASIFLNVADLSSRRRDEIRNARCRPRPPSCKSVCPCLTADFTRSLLSFSRERLAVGRPVMSQKTGDSLLCAATLAAKTLHSSLYTPLLLLMHMLYTDP